MIYFPKSYIHKGTLLVMVKLLAIFLVESQNSGTDWIPISSVFLIFFQINNYLQTPP